MDLKQLEYFVRVAELGSFTKAAIALGVAQPALSRQVRSLEVEYRQNLLLRNGRGVTTTEAGRLVLEQGRGILHQVERLRQELGRRRAALVGKVALGLPPSLSRALAVKLARAFSRELPEAALAMAEGLSAPMQDALIAGRIDVALLFDAAARPELELRTIGDQPLWLVDRRPRGGTGGGGGGGGGGIGGGGTAAATAAGAGPAALTVSKAVSLADLAGLPLVIPSRPNSVRMLVETALARVGLRPTIAVEVDAVAAIIELVLDGRGAAVLTREAIDPAIASGRLRVRPIGEPPLHCRLSLATSARRPSTPTLAAAVALIEREALGQVALGRLRSGEGGG